MIAVRFSSNADSLLEMFVHAVGNQEFRVFRPAVDALGQLDFLFAERLAVRGGGVLLVRRAPADVAVHDDERRPVARSEERAEAGANHVQIVRVGDVRDIPTVGGESRGHVFGKRQRRAAFDRDPVAVVDPAEIGKLEVPGKRSGFAGNSLHHAAIAAQRVHVEIVDVFKPGLIIS